MGYGAILNAFAYNYLTKTPNIPDYKLGIGGAELLSPLPVLVDPTNVIMPQVIKAKDLSSNTSNYTVNASTKYTDADFKGDVVYLGEAQG